jgi:hypothetical protein
VLASCRAKGYQKQAVSSTEPETNVPDGVPEPPPVTPGGLKKKTLAIIGVVTLAVWAFAIQTGSKWLMIVVGVLTLALVALLLYGLRLARKQAGLMKLLQSSVNSPEARRAAIAKLEQEKDANDVTNVFARAQLVAADDPAKALAMLEAFDIKNVPAQLQDDFAVLQAQLYLHSGRPKDARPLADRIYVDSPQRKDSRSMMVSVIAEAWARTGRHADALKLLETVDFDDKKLGALRIQLLVARTFANFASGHKVSASKDLRLIADVDVNHLGRFLMPQFRVHPDLQKLARGVAEKNPQARAMASKQAQQRGQRPR